MNALGRVALATLAAALFASAILTANLFTIRGDADRTHHHKHGGGPANQRYKALCQRVASARRLRTWSWRVRKHDRKDPAAIHQ
jgi:hypothetical protein